PGRPVGWRRDGGRWGCRVSASHTEPHEWRECDETGDYSDNIASGDNNPATANLQTFNPLFPSGMYFNLLNPVGPLNMIDLHPTLDLYVGKKITVSFDWDFYWRESLEDGVYAISGAPLRKGVAGSRSVGNSPAVTVAWNPTRHV